MHIKTIIAKVNQTVGLLQKFRQVLPRSSLFTICKLLVRTHVD